MNNPCVFIKCISGPCQGDTFRLKDGFFVGQSRSCQVRLKSPRVSSKGIQVLSKPDHSLFLKDIDSKNGIFLKEKGTQEFQRKKTVDLQRGVVFSVSEYQFSVYTSEDIEKQHGKYFQAQNDSWRQTLFQVLDDLQNAPSLPSQPKDPKDLDPQDLDPKAYIFETPLVLYFVEGVQCGTSWQLAYGPRNFGRYTSYKILEPMQEDLFFSIGYEEPQTKRQFFLKNLSSCPVLLNGKQIASDTLSDGDEIRLGKTLIRVRILQEENLKDSIEENSHEPRKKPPKATHKGP